MAYRESHKSTIEEVIISEFKSPFRNILLALVESNKNYGLFISKEYERHMNHPDELFYLICRYRGKFARDFTNVNEGNVELSEKIGHAVDRRLKTFVLCIVANEGLD